MRTAEESDDRLPASLHSLVLARVDRLPRAAKRCARAAVLGQRFRSPFCATSIAVPDYDCASAARRVAAAPGWREFAVRACADPAMAVYASLTRSRRAELHRAAAEWYRERDLALAAEHLDRAEHRRRSSAYLAAAQAQSAALHPGEALALASRGRGIAREPSDDLHALNMLCGRPALRRRRWQPCACHRFEHALAAADEPAQRCRALLGIAASHRLTGVSTRRLPALAELQSRSAQRTG